jgi:hypothetical protein
MIRRKLSDSLMAGTNDLFGNLHVLSISVRLNSTIQVALAKSAHTIRADNMMEQMVSSYQIQTLAVQSKSRTIRRVELLTALPQEGQEVLALALAGRKQRKIVSTWCLLKVAGGQVAVVR